MHVKGAFDSNLTVFSFFRFAISKGENFTILNCFQYIDFEQPDGGVSLS